jgi:hypothetical protein
MSARFTIDLLKDDSREREEERKTSTTNQILL